MSLLTVLQPQAAGGPIAASGESRLRLAAHGTTALALAVLTSLAPLQLRTSGAVSAQVTASADARQNAKAQGAATLTIGASGQGKLTLHSGLLAGEATPVIIGEGRLHLNAQGAAGVTVGVAAESRRALNAQGSATLPIGAAASGSQLKLAMSGMGMAAGSLEILSSALASLQLWGQGQAGAVSALLGQFVATLYLAPALDADVELSTTLEGTPFLVHVLDVKADSPSLAPVLDASVDTFPVLTVGTTVSTSPPPPLLAGDFSDDFSDDFFT